MTLLLRRPCFVVKACCQSLNLGWKQIHPRFPIALQVLHDTNTCRNNRTASPARQSKRARVQKKVGAIAHRSIECIRTVYIPARATRRQKFNPHVGTWSYNTTDTETWLAAAWAVNALPNTFLVGMSSPGVFVIEYSISTYSIGPNVAIPANFWGV